MATSNRRKAATTCPLVNVPGFRLTCPPRSSVGRNIEARRDLMKWNAADHKVFHGESKRRRTANANKTTQAESKQDLKQASWNKRYLAFVGGGNWFGLLGKNTDCLWSKWEEVESPELSGQFPIVHRTPFLWSFRFKHRSIVKAEDHQWRYSVVWQTTDIYS